MAKIAVAVEGMTTSLPSGVLPLPTFTGVGQLLGAASPTCKVSGKGVYQHGLSVSYSVVTLVDSTGTWVSGAGGLATATFASTATFSKADGSLVLRTGDKASFSSILFTQTLPTAGATKPVSFDLTITDAGQTLVLAE